jgi:DNA-binding CsgD family transcriptional regulator
MSTVLSASRLRGRRSECDALERLVAGARAGRSGALVLRGEAGVGKSALLDHVLRRASGCRVRRAAGVESERELAFATLHQLCAPVLDLVEHLPVPQRDALEIAFGLSEGSAPDRFLLGLAVLSLLSEVSDKRPLICLIDDAQWLDQASAQALAFVARRMLADPIALVFAVREPGDSSDLDGLPELTVGGIDDGDARALLASTILGRLDDQVRDRIIAETHGNPLALLELPRGLTPAQLAGGFALPDTRPLASRIEQSFIRRVHAFPRETRRLLLLAAAEPVGDVPLLWRAADRLEIGAEAAVPAETEGLIEFGARVRFRHPLVRSAAYRAAPLRECQEAHRALAEVTDPELDPDRRAWHLAHAAIGPDEAVASELERSADRAQGRGGIAAAAAFFERATELTPDPARRAARALAAAQAKFEAAAPDTAYELLASAEMGPLDELDRARLERLRARIVVARTRGGEAPLMMLDAAKRLEPLDAGLARETYLEALGAAIFAGRLGGGRGIREVAEAARAAPAASQPVRSVDLLLDGLAVRFTDGYTASVPALNQALEVFCREVDMGEADMGSFWLACRVAPELWWDERWNHVATQQVALARAAGALNILPIALTYRAGVHVHAGEFDAASALIDEAGDIAAATGTVPFMYTSLVLAAWRGREREAMELIQRSLVDAQDRGEGRAISLAQYAMAVLYNGLGRYDLALGAAQRACEHDDLGLYGWALVELVEAASRSGNHDVADAAHARLSERTRVSGSDWGLGMQARSHALLSDGEDAEDLYEESLERLGRTHIAVHLARVHLVYGEWLRREGRRVQAREHLSGAHDAFTRMGAEGFAERARRELMATGGTVRKRTDEARDELTSQEAQIAQLAAEGQTNPEIAAQLFISPRTVEWHLRKVFSKLEIRSRHELRTAPPLASDDAVAVPSS